MREALAILGLARRAGAVVVGTDRVRRSLRRGEVSLVVTAEDASVVQRRKIEGLASHRGVPRVTLGSKRALGRAVGAAPSSVVALTEPRFGRRLMEALPVGPDGLEGGH